MSAKIVKLGDVAHITAAIVDPKLQEFRDLAHVSGENITPVTGQLIGVKSAGADGVKSGKYQFDVGDVLYSKLRPYLRKAALAEAPGLCSADIYPLKVEAAKLLPAYLRMILVTPRFTAYAVEQSARTRMPKLNREQLFSYRFRLPELDSQRAVVRLVTSTAPDITRAQAGAKQQVSDIASLADAAFRAAFHSVTPISVPPIPRAHPTGWRWRKLVDLAQLESGHTPSRLRPDWWGGSISWLSLTEIREFDGSWVSETRLRTNEEGIANSAARVLPRGTVCLSRTASVGFVAIMGAPMATSQDFANWVCGEELDPDFLMYALIASRRALREMATGATHKTIYMPALEAFQICAPDITKQRRIGARLKTQLAEVAVLRSAIKRRCADIGALPLRILASAVEM